MRIYTKNQFLYKFKKYLNLYTKVIASTFGSNKNIIIQYYYNKNKYKIFLANDGLFASHYLFEPEKNAFDKIIVDFLFHIAEHIGDHTTLSLILLNLILNENPDILKLIKKYKNQFIQTKPSLDFLINQTFGFNHEFQNLKNLLLEILNNNYYPLIETNHNKYSLKDEIFYIKKDEFILYGKFTPEAPPELIINQIDLPYNSYNLKINNYYTFTPTALNFEGLFTYFEILKAIFSKSKITISFDKQSISNIQPYIIKIQKLNNFLYKLKLKKESIDYQKLIKISKTIKTQPNSMWEYLKALSTFSVAIILISGLNSKIIENKKRYLDDAIKISQIYKSEKTFYLDLPFQLLYFDITYKPIQILIENFGSNISLYKIKKLLKQNKIIDLKNNKIYNLNEFPLSISKTALDFIIYELEKTIKFINSIYITLQV